MIWALIRLTRLYYTLPLSAGFIVILSYLTAGTLSPFSATAILSSLSFAFIISAAYVFNDVCDVQIDKINAPQRPLAAEKISPPAAMKIAIGLMLIGLTCSVICSAAFFGCMAGLAGLLFAYDLYSKNMGFLKDIFAAALTTSLYPLALILVDSVASGRLNVLWIHPIWLFFTSMGYQMLKDIRDIKGDSMIQRRLFTPHRQRTYARISRSIIFLASLVTLWPYFAGYCHEVYLAASIITVCLALACVFCKTAAAIRLTYAQVFIITVGSMVDLQVFGP